jgi:hypothetical protein
LLPERLGSWWAVEGFDAFQDFALGQSPGHRHFTEQMEVIAHQDVLQNPDPGESLQAAHQGDKELGLNRPTLRSPEDEAAFDDSGDAVVKTLTLNFDPRETHKGIVHNIY